MIDFVVPVFELMLEILPVVETTHLEEAAFDPTDEILYRALLLGPARSAQLRCEAVVQGHLAEGAIPLDLLLLAAEHHGLRIVEDGDQRDTAPGFETTEQRAYQGLDTLVRHDSYLRPA